MRKLLGLFTVFIASLVLVQAASAGVLINEFSHQGTDDWIELYNDGGTDVDLTDWTIQDGAFTPNVLELDGTIRADDYQVFDWSRLNNDGDIIELINDLDVTVDDVTYGDYDDGDTSDNAPAVDDDINSVGRYPNGADTDTDDDDFMSFIRWDGHPSTPFFANILSDTTVPEVSEDDVIVSPDEVNVDDDSVIVTVTLNVDDESPMDYIDVRAESPDYEQRVYNNGFEYNHEDGTYSVELEIPQYSADGTWEIDRVYLGDVFGNSEDYFQHDYGEVTFEVVSTTPDTEAPVLDVDSIEFDPTSANFGETVTLIFEASDDVSGINLDDSNVCIRDAGDNFSDCEDITVGAEEGTYQAEFTIYTTEELTIYLTEIDLEDNVGNDQDYDYFSFGSISFRANPSGNYGVSLTDPADQTVNVNVDAVYTINIENTGDDPDTFDLSVSESTADTSTLSTDTISLNNGANADVTLTVGSATAGTYSIDVTATSRGDASETDTVTIVTTVEVPSNDLTVTNIRTITTEVEEDDGSVEATFTIDAGDSGIDDVYFTVDDLELSWTGDSDGKISSENIKFYREDGTEITKTNMLQLSVKEVTVRITVPDEGGIDLYGSYSSTIHIKNAADSDVKTTDLNININPKEYDYIGDRLKIEDIELPDDDLYRGNEVTVTVTVENDYSEDLEDVKITIINPELDINEESDEFDLDEDEDEEVEFTFDIPSDIDQGKYKLYVFVEGEDAEDSSKDLYNFEVSSDKLEIYVESHHLHAEFDLDKDTYKAGETIRGKLKLYNSGTNDEEDIIVKVSSDELNYDRSFQFNSLNDGKSKTIDLSIPVSRNTENGVIEIGAEIRYDDMDNQEDDDNIDNDLFKSVFVTISEGVEGEAEEANILGTTTATATPGREVKFTLNLKNEGDSSETYTLEVEDYSSWAENVRVEPSELPITSGADVPFYVYITPKSGITGRQTADIVAYVGSEEVASEELTVTVNGEGVIQITELGSQITGAVSGVGLNTPTAILISSFVAAIVILAGIYMFTFRREL